jgi:flagella basal body P-ring formation protein FlgA
MRIVSSLRATALCALAYAPCPASAALLRSFSEITGPTGRLADLFDQLGSTPDRVLGRGPAPGARIVVGSPQLAAIARDFNVDWRPATGAEQAIVECRGDPLPPAQITAMLRVALQNAGAPDDFEVAAPDLQPMLVPVGSIATPDVSQLSYDRQGGNFTALITVRVPGASDMRMRVSGAVIAMVPAAVTTRRLLAGNLVGPGDVQIKQLRAALVRAGVAILPQSAIGMALKHDVPMGQPLMSADVTRQMLVQRGQIVHMTLNSDGIALSGQGRATDAGARGDHVRVENPASHRMIDAEVTGAGEVRVSPQTATATLAAAR